MFNSSRAPCTPPVALEVDPPCDINVDDVDAGERVKLVVPACLPAAVDNVCPVELLLYLEDVVVGKPDVLNWLRLG